MQLSPSATFSFYGDSISDIRNFASFSVSLGRALEGRIRFAENAGIQAHVELGTRPAWDLAVSGATVSEITQRLLATLPHDEADVVFVLMGANNYGNAGPGTGTPQDWKDRADDIVAAAAAANKLLVFLTPLSHRNDPIEGREILKAYLPTLASDRVIVPDMSAFDHRVHTDDGVHPNQAGAALMADLVSTALGTVLPAASPLPEADIEALNLLDNGDLAGTSGTLRNLQPGQVTGEVANGWTLERIAGTSTVVAAKGLSADGDIVQMISADNGGSVRLKQAVALTAAPGEQYEVVFNVRVTDPEANFLGVWVTDGDKADGTLLFANSVQSSSYGPGTGSFEATLRSPKLTLTAGDSNAIVELIMQFGTGTAVVEIGDVLLRRVPVDAPPPPAPPSEAEIIAALEADPTTLLLTAGADTRTGPKLEAIGMLGRDGTDTLRGGDLGDTLAGEAGRDTLVGNNGDDLLLGGDNEDSLSGGAGNDRLLGGLAADTLTGGSGEDRLEGGAGNDLLNGNDGNDLLLGDSGVDRLFGYAGTDSLDGGGGADALTGGTGADLFRLTNLDAVDTVNDFRVAEADQVDLSDILPSAALYDFANYVRVTPLTGAKAMVAVDLDGRGTAHGFVDAMLLSLGTAVPITEAQFLI